jgi:hypothetical protein
VAEGGQPCVAEAKVETQGKDEPDQQLCPEGCELPEIGIKRVEEENEKDPEIGISKNLLHQANLRLAYWFDKGSLKPLPESFNTGIRIIQRYSALQKDPGVENR